MREAYCPALRAVDRRDENPYAEGVRAPIPWNFYLIYVGSTLYFMSYSLEVRCFPANLPASSASPAACPTGTSARPVSISHVRPACVQGATGSLTLLYFNYKARISRPRTGPRPMLARAHDPRCDIASGASQLTSPACSVASAGVGIDPPGQALRGCDVLAGRDAHLRRAHPRCGRHLDVEPARRPSPAVPPRCKSPASESGTGTHPVSLSLPDLALRPAP